MDELRKRAKELLESGAVKIIIGFEQGTGNKTRAVFVQKPEDVSKLIFDSRCVLNLAVYLNKPEVKQIGKPAIVAPIPVLRAIIQLASENQFTDDNLLILRYIYAEFFLRELQIPVIGKKIAYDKDTAC